MSDSTFTLHPQLEQDSVFITDLTLCTVRLINDNNYPWVVLIPRRDGATETHKLSSEDQQQITLESAILCKTMDAAFKPERMNVAALGNMVPQLHIHHVARHTKDAAWPGPIWGVVKSVPYEATALEKRIKAIATGIMEQQMLMSGKPNPSS